MEGLQAKVAGGALEGSASVEVGARPPAFSVNLRLADAVVPGPVSELPLDLTSGALAATANLTAAGYSPAGLLASLGGEVQVAVRDGVLAGIDLGRAGTELKPADVQAALDGGSMGFERMELGARISLGRAMLQDTSIATRSGTGGITGSLDLPPPRAELRLA